MEIVQYPDKRLRLKCRPVRSIDESTKRQAARLLAALRFLRTPLRALAANQIGVEKRIVAFQRIGRKPVVMINPEIISASITCPSVEICASLRRTVRLKKRKFLIRVRFTDLQNRKLTWTLLGFAAFTMQQEIDHLNGKLIID